MTLERAVELLNEHMDSFFRNTNTREAWDVVTEALEDKRVLQKQYVDVDCPACGHGMQVEVDAA